MNTLKEKTIAKAALSAVGVAMTALVLTTGTASADHIGHRHGHSHHHGDAVVVVHHGEKVRIATRHDHRFKRRAYGRHGYVVHNHSGYGPHAHLEPKERGHYARHHSHQHPHHDHKSLAQKKKLKALIGVLGAVKTH